jgi:Protein of unknown function (DUF1769)
MTPFRGDKQISENCLQASNLVYSLCLQSRQQSGAGTSSSTKKPYNYCNSVEVVQQQYCSRMVQEVTLPTSSVSSSSSSVVVIAAEASRTATAEAAATATVDLGASPSDDDDSNRNNILVPIDSESLEPIHIETAGRGKRRSSYSFKQKQSPSKRNRRQGRRSSTGSIVQNNNNNSPFQRLKRSILGNNRPSIATIQENQPLLPLFSSQEQQQQEEEERDSGGGCDITPIMTEQNNSTVVDFRSSSTSYGGEMVVTGIQQEKKNVTTSNNGQQQISSSSSNSLPNNWGNSNLPLGAKNTVLSSNEIGQIYNRAGSSSNPESEGLSSISSLPKYRSKISDTSSSNTGAGAVGSGSNGDVLVGGATRSTSQQPGTPIKSPNDVVPSSTTGVDAAAVAASPAMPALTMSPNNKSKKSSLLLSGSRKVVKATVVRPARAVSRVFRGSSSNGNSNSNKSSSAMNASSTHSTTTGETDVLIGQLNASTVRQQGVRGYGSMDHSGHGTVLSVDGTVLDDPTVASIVRRLDGSGTDPSLRVHGLLANSTSMSGNKNVDWPVHSVEALTRHIVLGCIAYLIGVHHPEWVKHVARTSEFAATAWVTCLAILILSFFQRRFPHLIGTSEQPHYIPAVTSPLDERNSRFISQQRVYDTAEEQNPLLSQQPRDHAPGTLNDAEAAMIQGVGENETSIEVEHALVDRVPSVDDVGVCPPRTATQTAEHVAMNDFYVIDTSSGRRVQCNAATPYHLSNEWFEMHMLALIRTPDADDSNAPKGTPANEMISTYMRGRQRRFEFQYQVKLKKKPVGKQVYFACELEETVKMGMVTKAFVGAAMAFVKTTNPTFHYSITGSKDKSGDGKYEKPHMSFTVEGSLDRLVVTKPGETPPQLGQPIYEDPESIRRRKKGILTDWNTTDTYTMALWSSYVDFLDWKVLNLPGIRPFGLSSVLGSQPIYLTMYMIDEKRDSDKHYRKDIDEVVKLELSNGDVSEMGPAAKLWSQTTDQLVHPSGASVSTTAASTNFAPPAARGRALSDESNHVSRKASALAGTGDGNDTFDTILPVGGVDDVGMDDIEEVDEDVETAAELGEGIYLRSGDSVVLREMMLTDGGNVGEFSVGVGGGFAVLQPRDVSVVIEKAKKSTKNKLIKSGDTVLFKLFQNKPGSDEVETQYLTIHRGWWLKWYVLSTL